MECSTQFLPAYRAWIAIVRERLASLDDREVGLEECVLPSDFTLELYRLRRECTVLDQSVRTRRALGLVEPALQVRASELLHDLRWLLGISPLAPPALARQCIRMALDRIGDELQDSTEMQFPQELLDVAS
jgi:hypothetical protein